MPDMVVSDHNLPKVLLIVDDNPADRELFLQLIHLGKLPLDNIY
jgi:hypothetical protein